MLLEDLLPYIDYSCFLHLIDYDNNSIGVFDLINYLPELNIKIIPDHLLKKEIFHIFPNNSHYLDIVVR